MFNETTGAYTFWTTDMVQYPPGIYVLQFSAAQSDASLPPAAVQIEIVLRDPNCALDLALVMEPIPDAIIFVGDASIDTDPFILSLDQDLCPDISISWIC